VAGAVARHTRPVEVLRTRPVEVLRTQQAEVPRTQLEAEVPRIRPEAAVPRTRLEEVALRRAAHSPAGEAARRTRPAEVLRIRPAEVPRTRLEVEVRRSLAEGVRRNLAEVVRRTRLEAGVRRIRLEAGGRRIRRGEVAATDSNPVGLEVLNRRSWLAKSQCADCRLTLTHQGKRRCGELTAIRRPVSLVRHSRDGPKQSRCSSTVNLFPLFALPLESRKSRKENAGVQLLADKVTPMRGSWRGFGFLGAWQFHKDVTGSVNREASV